MTQVRVHYLAIWAWALQFVGAVVCLILAFVRGIEPVDFFLLSVGYISLCSIYANLVGHWGAWEAAKAKQAIEEES